MTQYAFAAFTLLLTAASALAVPPPRGGGAGRWWRNSEVVERLKLTKEQQQRLDQVFQQTATQLVDLKADVEKRSIALRHELDQVQPRRQEVQRLAAEVGAARSRLFERELMMLLDMRAALTNDQWSEARELLEHRGAAGRQGPRHHGARPRGERRAPRGGMMPPPP